MYERFVEKRGGAQSRALLDIFTSDPVFTVGCLLLLLLIACLTYGFAVPKEEYAHESAVRQEYRNPPSLRPYILVSKGAKEGSLDLDLDISAQARSPKTHAEKWIPKPASYKPKSDEVVFRDASGELKVFPAHLLGTDSQGRDIFRRTIVGARVYILPSIMAIVFSIFLGILLGILGANIWSGWLAGLRFFTHCLMDVLESLPRYITILLAIILIPPESRHFQWHGINWYGFYWLSIVLGILSAPRLGKLIMERIDVLRKREFIEAARALGISKFKVAFKHVIRYNCLSLIFTQAVALISEVMLLEIVLSYLTDGTEWGRGITVAEPEPSFGNILVSGRYYLFDSWWISLFPLLALLLTASVIYMFAHGLNRIYTRHRTSTELW